MNVSVRTLLAAREREPSDRELANRVLDAKVAEIHAEGKQGYGRGGANRYLVNGKMTVGFAFVAYPAQYRSSGVMTSIVGSDEVAYQQDLGKKTGVVATAMKRHDPGAGWHKAKVAQEETARVQETK